MSVKVLITRTVPGDKGREMLGLFREMRTLATAQSGYISGETMKSNDRPDVFLVISTWESTADWEAWLLSKERQAIQKKSRCTAWRQDPLRIVSLSAAGLRARERIRLECDQAGCAAIQPYSVIIYAVMVRIIIHFGSIDAVAALGWF